MSAEIEAFLHAPTSTWSYVVSDPATARAAVIDAVLDYEPKSGRTGTESVDAIVAYVRRRALDVEWVLETHAHADHLAGTDALRRAFGAKTAIGAGIRKVQETFKHVYGLGADFVPDGAQFDHLFEDGETFLIGSLSGRVMATPGHTNDSVTFLIGDAAFVGDTVFMPDGGTARCDFPGGDARALYRSVQKLYALPDSTRIFVCHDYPPPEREPQCASTVAEHKRANIHLSSQTSEADFVQLRETRDATLEMPNLIIPSVQVNIRAGRLPEPAANGIAYLKIPLNTFGRPAKEPS
jgi:glyoxylase-like metal-dependent hydrolase (beta-lactamase superfamily II)